MKKTIQSTFFTLLINSIFLNVSFAQTGSLDPTFGSAGKVNTPSGTGSIAQSYTSVLQGDGKILMGGYSYDSNTESDFTLVRYNTNGTLDNTFGTNGIVNTNFGGDDDIAYAIALQSDCKIVVGGSKYNSNDNDFALARYNSNGSLDFTFGTGGKVVTDFGYVQEDVIYSIVIQSDGKIVAAGSTYTGIDHVFAVVRYNSNGSLDNTFGTNGIVTSPITDDEIKSVKLQSDGKIVVGGYSYEYPRQIFAMMRYNTDGTLDNTFGTGGIVTTTFGNYYYKDFGSSLDIQSDGKILLSGYNSNSSDDDFTLLRYNTNGSVDSTFGTDGAVVTAIGSSNDRGIASLLQSDGKILIAGMTYNTSDSDFALIRYTSTGSLDNTFGNAGIVTTDFGNADDAAHSIMMQSDGKIVVGGNNDIGFALARYTNDSNARPANAGLCASVSTSINETAALTNIVVSPNPSTGVFHLQMNALTTAQVKVYNVLGECVYKNAATSSIDLSAEPEGVYFMSVQTNEGTTTQKIVIGQ